METFAQWSGIISCFFHSRMGVEAQIMNKLFDDNIHGHVHIFHGRGPVKYTWVIYTLIYYPTLQGALVYTPMANPTLPSEYYIKYNYTSISRIWLMLKVSYHYECLIRLLTGHSIKCRSVYLWKILYSIPSSRQHGLSKSVHSK